MSPHAALLTWNGRRLKAGERLTEAEILEAVARASAKPGAFQRPTHPEALWLQPWVRGLSADIGCGAEKVHPTCFGIDRLEPGQAGTTGCMLGVGARADLSADAGNLSVIPDGTFDTVVSRHCFEHLPDPARTLREWLRIVHPGGFLALVLPDDRARDFTLVDSDHKFRCYPETIKDALERLNAAAGAVRGTLVELGTTVVPQWSFFSLLRRALP